MIRKLTCAALAASLSVAPATAAPSKAEALSIQRAHAPASEGENLVGGAVYWFTPVVAVLVLIGILAATETWPFKGSPRSP
jgi:hypothetical protein